jgi:hypothetical protein|tara:strand:+ start:756 stop:1439 length:684 start_codon:yes stop_codon:yes gene_type:complete
MQRIKKIKKGVSEKLRESEKGIKYEFHKWKKQLIIADKLIYVIVVLLLGLVRPDALMIGVYLMLYPYLLLTERKSAFYHLFVASVIALVWMLIANNQYGYNREMMIIFGLNSFPLFAWAAGLFAAYLIYSHWEHILKEQGWLKKMLLFVAFYWPILISLETIAYHLFNIKNLSTAMYAGLPICDCIHAPGWMQASYLALGPIYFGVCELIGLENPHHVKKKSIKQQI